MLKNPNIFVILKPANELISSFHHGDERFRRGRDSFACCKPRRLTSLKTGKTISAKNTGKAFNFGFARTNAYALAA